MAVDRCRFLLNSQLPSHLDGPLHVGRIWNMESLTRPFL